jgi:hypothetical protein
MFSQNNVWIFALNYVPQNCDYIFCTFVYEDCSLLGYSAVEYC